MLDGPRSAQPGDYPPTLAHSGSGISRNNHFTARGLVKVLGLFAPHADLLRGHDGGMNKTGTMEGVPPEQASCALERQTLKAN
jgi:hypothetical protein